MGRAPSRFEGLCALSWLLLLALLAGNARAILTGEQLQRLIDGDQNACQVFLQEAGIAALQSSGAGSDERWDHQGIFSAWEQSVGSQYSRMSWGRWRFAGEEDTVLFHELAARLRDLDASLISAAPPCGAGCQARQRAALRRVYEASQGPSWTNAAMRRLWASDLHHCCWPGVVCCTADHALPTVRTSADGEPADMGTSRPFATSCVRPGGVAAVDLSSGLNFIGQGSAAPPTLPGDALLDLADSLEYFGATGMGLRGAVPTAVLSLRLLRSLDLRFNRLSGELPGATGTAGDGSDWSLHLRMSDAMLEGNELSGPVPESLRSALSLRFLDVSSNKFQGLPAGLFGLPWLRVLVAGYNSDLDVTSIGTEPAVGPRLFLMQGLSGEFLGSPNFAVLGRFDAALDAEPIAVRIRRAGLSGSLPQAISHLDLGELDLGENRLTGTIPPSTFSIVALTRLFLDGNDLDGALPERSSVRSLQALDLADNPRLTSTLPPWLGRNLDLTLLRVARTNIFGELPVGLSAQRLALLDITDTLMAHNRSRPNSRGELLPEYLRFGEQLDNVDDAQRLQCRRVHLAGAGATQGVVSISARYHHFSACSCEEGFELRPGDGLDAHVAARVEQARTSAAGWEADFAPQPTPVCVDASSGDALPLDARVGVSVGAVVLVLVVLALATAFVMRRHIAVAMLERRKTTGPPQANHYVTLVVTDVQGSTDLWERYPDDMMTASTMHDNIMRDLLTSWHGYEVTTEGDAFIVAFHTADDALGWCVSVQQKLLTAPWPATIQSPLPPRVAAMGPLPWEGRPAHPFDPSPESSWKPTLPRGDAEGGHALGYMSPRLSHVRFESGAPREDPAESPQAVEVSPALLFGGLSVRMGVATGKPTSATRHRVTGRMTYSGEVLRQATAIQEAAQGGQILLCGRTRTHAQMRVSHVAARVKKGTIAAAVARRLQPVRREVSRKDVAKMRRKSRLTQFAEAVVGSSGHRGTILGGGPNRASTPQHPQVSLLANRRASSGAQRPAADQLRVHRLDPQFASLSGRVAPSRGTVSWLQPPPDAGSAISDAADDSRCPRLDEDAAASRRTRRVTMCSAAASVGDRESLQVRPSGLSMSASLRPNLGVLGSTLKESRVARLLSTVVASWRASRAKSGLGQESNGLLLLDMGEVQLLPSRDGAAPVRVYQLLVPRLEDRARVFERPEWEAKAQLCAGYFDAPGARCGPLVGSAAAHGGDSGNGLLAPALDSNSGAQISRQLDLPVPEITICFCMPSDSQALHAGDAASRRMLEAYRETVRVTLTRFRGYECQEIDGTFMLVFHAMADGLMWSTCVKTALDELLTRAQLGGRASTRSEASGARGVPVRIGMYEGRPARVMPHPSSGRADYFGPLVNRAARVAAASQPEACATAPFDQIMRACSWIVTGPGAHGWMCEDDVGLARCRCKGAADPGASAGLFSGPGHLVGMSAQATWITTDANILDKAGGEVVQDILAARESRRVASQAGGDRSSHGPRTSAFSDSRSAARHHPSSMQSRNLDDSASGLVSGTRTIATAGFMPDTAVSPRVLAPRTSPGPQRTGAPAGGQEHAFLRRSSERESTPFTGASVHGRRATETERSTACGPADAGTSSTSEWVWTMREGRFEVWHAGLYKMKGLSGPMDLGSLTPVGSDAVGATGIKTSKKIEKLEDGLGRAVLLTVLRHTVLRSHPKAAQRREAAGAHPRGLLAGSRFTARRSLRKVHVAGPSLRHKGGTAPQHLADAQLHDLRLPGLRTNRRVNAGEELVLPPGPPSLRSSQAAHHFQATIEEEV
ncbi:unnamed protein product [Pedinophyceae sp. YPF-701]|nr:unnamed protein product [Pedinophyceae sp. YPF-701]